MILLQEADELTPMGLLIRQYLGMAPPNEGRLLVVLDGMRIYEPYHLRDLLSLFSVVDSNTIDGVDFYTGAFPVQYGAVNSGVLDIHSRTPDPEYPHRIGVSFTNAFVQTSGSLPGGDGQWMVSGRTGYLDVVLDIIARP